MPEAGSSTLIRHLVSRRRAVATGGAGLLAVLHSPAVFATAQGSVSGLWIQQFSSGSLELTGNDTAILTLFGGTDFTTIIADTGVIGIDRVWTQSLVEGSLAPGGYQAALVLSDSETDVRFLVTILGAEVDLALGTVTYSIVFSDIDALNALGDGGIFGSVDIVIGGGELALAPARLMPVAVGPQVRRVRRVFRAQKVTPVMLGRQDLRALLAQLEPPARADPPELLVKRDRRVPVDRMASLE